MPSIEPIRCDFPGCDHRVAERWELDSHRIRHEPPEPVATREQGIAASDAILRRLRSPAPRPPRADVLDALKDARDS